uniref:glutathione transferase n=1 Tax=Opuntia streptacantha TaxID=393608 RepID=A0A7C8Z588_OPUST
MGQVKVFGYWPSPYSRRVEIALKIKGVEYEYVEEDLQNKSRELLLYNPVHKKIPVLVHAGNPIAESFVVLEYIDETWKGNPLLPSDPYERAQARFWAKFFDDKLLPAVRSALYNASEGEEAQKVNEDAEEVLKTLEKEVKGKKFLGGNEIGFLDIVGIVAAYWMPTLQEAADNKRQVSSHM